MSKFMQSRGIRRGHLVVCGSGLVCPGCGGGVIRHGMSKTGPDASGKSDIVYGGGGRWAGGVELGESYGVGFCRGADSVQGVELSDVAHGRWWRYPAAFILPILAAETLALAAILLTGIT